MPILQPLNIHEFFVEKLKAKLDEILQNNTKEIRREQYRFENATYNLNINAACPWYQKYRDTFLAHSLIYPHERIRHLISTSIIIIDYQ